MRFCVAALAILLAPAAVLSEKTEKAESKRKPVITSAIFYDTATLVHDVYDTLHSSLIERHVNEQSPKVMAIIDEQLKKAGVKKEELTAKYDQAMGHVSSITATLAVQKAAAFEKLDRIAAKFADKFDQLAPRYAGAVPNNFVDLLVFGAYVMFVMYVALRILRVALGMYCFFCCCGCLRGGKPTAAAKGKKGGAAAAAGKKADSGVKPKKK